ncbi:MAG: MotA/TolQ/ExbB proton channel family protein [Pseudobdellovibrionaceae bacterium]|uniref:MotA/TolQ/ExbB proton channel family protein n=1 Tax=Oligoflexus sp. TaxID=1971216 RepID=UPI0027C8939E|nr:MotA/TolQ/ExbB proton channel family protein [Oligoflexus sp.]MDQ3233767.1 MotA/TolQ/ExbB proton channel family protein [Pseudobdellovibrionaceae bacterium]HYX32709.1 MotA/TolQ/ExbB proton channel family protein [Oligoflexus sp.]
MDKQFNIVEELLQMTLLGTEWVLWLLIILSVVSIAIAVERFWFFMRQGRLRQEVIEDFYARVRNRDYTGASELVSNYPNSLEAKVALEGLNHRDGGLGSIQESTTAYLLRQRKVLDRGLVVLATLGNNAPFIGLFGTVLGIIKAFHDLGTNPAGGATVVMAGISEALVATAIGLLVAIPAVIAFNYFQRQIKVIATDAQAMVSTLVAGLGEGFSNPKGNK